ncbi:MAG: histidine--tRNA ligase [Chloroflexi bacterium]|nr:histidine--tRNA ligase [Chloroflexota bacterium]
MKTIIQSVKGTRDFYPREMAIRNWLYQKSREVSEAFGYQEFEGPILESINLYAAKSGEELVKEQSFVFHDRSNKLITLRPELTPTLMRMVAQRQQQLHYPLRWWSFGPFWRYERPQKGRTREFFQWNIDLIGNATPEMDAEMVAVMASFYQSVGLNSQEVTISVNNRRLIDQQLDVMGIAPESRPQVIRLIDRKEKLSPEAWEKYAFDINLSHQQVNQLNALMENLDLWKESHELVRFFETIDALGVSDYVQYNPKVIRGLDYYTGTVYEGHSISTDIRRALAGGGRYDNLLADVGGNPLPGTGFAMGDLVITLLLEELGHLPENLGQSPAPVLVTVFNEELLLSSYRLAAELRTSGLKIATYPIPDKLGKQFRYAERIGARIALVLGATEQANHQVAIKDLRSREQIVVPQTQAFNKISEILAGDSPS